MIIDHLAWRRKYIRLHLNDNLPVFDYVQALFYNQKCIKEFQMDALKGFPKPLINKSPKVKMNAYWLAKFEYITHQKRKEYAKAFTKKKLSLVPERSEGTVVPNVQTK